MCGRYNLTEGAMRKFKKELEEVFGDNVLGLEFESNYNVAPTHKMPVITNEQPMKISALQWGLIPFWAKDAKVGYNMINTRSETILEKNAFKNLISRKRCLIPAEGFYEWKKISSKEKQPYNIRLKSGIPFCFAGVWDQWTDKASGEIISTYSVITTQANEIVKEVHDRMPVILDRKQYAAWLNNDTPLEDIIAMLKPLDAEKMEKYVVDKSVGNPANNHSGLLKASFVQQGLF